MDGYCRGDKGLQRHKGLAGASARQDRGLFRQMPLRNNSNCEDLPLEDEIVRQHLGQEANRLLPPGFDKANRARPGCRSGASGC